MHTARVAFATILVGCGGQPTLPERTLDTVTVRISYDAFEASDSEGNRIDHTLTFGDGYLETNPAEQQWAVATIPILQSATAIVAVHEWVLLRLEARIQANVHGRGASNPWHYPFVQPIGMFGSPSLDTWRRWSSNPGDPRPLARGAQYEVVLFLTHGVLDEQYGRLAWVEVDFLVPGS